MIKVNEWKRKYNCHLFDCTQKQYKLTYRFVDPLTSKQYDHVKSLTDEIHTQFINDLKSSRKDKINPDDKLIYSGLFYTGNQAKALGLVDDISSIYKLNNEEYENMKIQKYNSENNLINQLIQTSFHYLFQNKINY